MKKVALVLFLERRITEWQFVQDRKKDPSMALMNYVQLVLIKTSIQIRYCLTFGQIDFLPDKSLQVAVK